MHLEIVKLREMVQRQVSDDTAYMWKSWKGGTNELIYKTEIRVTDVDNKLMVWRGGARGGSGGGEKSGVWAWHMYTAMYKIDNKDRLYSTGNST